MILQAREGIGEPGMWVDQPTAPAAEHEQMAIVRIAPQHLRHQQRRRSHRIGTWSSYRESLRKDSRAAERTASRWA